MRKWLRKRVDAQRQGPWFKADPSHGEPYDWAKEPIVPDAPAEYGHVRDADHLNEILERGGEIWRNPVYAYTGFGPFPVLIDEGEIQYRLPGGPNDA